MLYILAPFTNGGLVVIFYFTILDFDIEIVGPNRGIDDRTSAPFPYYIYNGTLSNAAGIWFAGVVLV